MKSFVKGLAIIAGVLATSCVTYSGVSKANDGQIWISGGTNYFIISVPFIKRCDVDGTILKCEELSEQPPPSARRGAAPADSAAPAPSAKPAPAAAPPAK